MDRMVSDVELKLRYEDRRSEFFKVNSIEDNKQNFDRYSRFKAIGYSSKDMSKMMKDMEIK